MHPVLPPVAPLTVEYGRVGVVGALRLAQLAQLLVDCTAGDEGLHLEAVALPSVQVCQLDVVGL